MGMAVMMAMGMPVAMMVPVPVPMLVSVVMLMPCAHESEEWHGNVRRIKA